MAFQLSHAVRLVRYDPEACTLEFSPAEGADPRLAQDLGERLRALTGQRWMVSVTSGPAQATLAEQARAADQARFDAAGRDPMALAVREVFPGAKLRTVTPRREALPAPAELGTEDGAGPDTAEFADPDEIDVDGLF
jgi:DNA polymerase-3 subunit gamma/tau